MQGRDRDAVVLGGGPAGAATALCLARAGLRVTLLDRGAEDRTRIGEMVPPAIQVPLRELGVWERFLAAGHLAVPATRSAWGSSEIRYEDFLFSVHGDGWHLDRDRFDRLLLDAAAEAGAEVIFGLRVAPPVRNRQMWELADRFRTPWLVDAAGRSSQLSGWVGRERISYDRLVGLIGYLEPASRHAAGGATLLLEAVEEGWWYSAPLPDGRTAAVFMTDSDLVQAARRSALELWRHQLRRSTHTADRLSGSPLPREILVRPAHTCRIDRPAEPGCIAVGDAALAFDPLSSQGILKALGSALAVRRALLDSPDTLAGLTAYGAEIEAELDRYLRLRGHYYFLETRWPEAPFWRRRRRPDPRRVRITLDPRTVLAFRGLPESSSLSEVLSGLLPPGSLAGLCELLSPPAEAHAVAAAFKRRYSEVDDQGLILALQILLESGSLGSDLEGK